GAATLAGRRHLRWQRVRAAAACGRLHGLGGAGRRNRGARAGAGRDPARASGHVGMFEESVTFDITTIRGIANALFGGDGIFLVQLTGPGRVWLQTLTMPNLAHALSPYLHKGEVPPTQAVEAG